MEMAAQTSVAGADIECVTVIGHLNPARRSFAPITARDLPAAP
jgi:hypothetical protein